jgi:phenylacetic acid degradation operon negative regulatory protein
VGWIEGVRRGRESWWSLTREGRRLVEDGVRRVEALGQEPAPWDGQWLVLLISVPHDIRSVRQGLYRSLSWAGFGSPGPGVWLSPFPDRQPIVGRVIERLKLSAYTMTFIGSAGEIGLSDSDIVAKAWALHEVDDLYTGLVDRFDACDPGTDLEALLALLALDEELQRLPMIDPQLPSELARGRSSRRDAARLLDLRAGWLPTARQLWHEIEQAHRET